MEQTSSSAPSSPINPVRGLHRRYGRGRLILGIIILVIGFYFLGKNLGWWPEASKFWSILWSVVIIIIGFAVIFRRKNR